MIVRSLLALAAAAPLAVPAAAQPFDPGPQGSVVGQSMSGAPIGGYRAPSRPLSIPNAPVFGDTVEERTYGRDYDNSYLSPARRAARRRRNLDAPARSGRARDDRSGHGGRLRALGRFGDQQQRRDAADLAAAPRPDRALAGRMQLKQALRLSLVERIRCPSLFSGCARPIRRERPNPERPVPCAALRRRFSVLPPSPPCRSRSRPRTVARRRVELGRVVGNRRLQRRQQRRHDGHGPDAEPWRRQQPDRLVRRRRFQRDLDAAARDGRFHHPQPDQRGCGRAHGQCRRGVDHRQRRNARLQRLERHGIRPGRRRPGLALQHPAPARERRSRRHSLGAAHGPERDPGFARQLSHRKAVSRPRRRRPGR